MWLKTLTEGLATKQQFEIFAKFSKSEMALLETPIGNLIDSFNEAQRKYNEAIETWNSFDFGPFLTDAKGEGIKVQNVDVQAQVKKERLTKGK